MTSILPPAKTTFSDPNGKPLALGHVAFYTPGTTTAKTTWSDRGATAANANPIPLDSRGQASIWGAGAYRQVVTDAAGVTVWDQEVVGLPDPIAVNGLPNRPSPVPALPFMDDSTLLTSPVLVACGSEAVPITAPQLTIAALLDTTGSAGTDYGSGAAIFGNTNLRGETNGAIRGARAGFLQVIDWVGNPALPVGNGTFTETLRIHAITAGGVSFTNGEGLIVSAIGEAGGLPHAHLVAAELHVDNLWQDAPVCGGFNPSQFSAMLVLSTGEPGGGTYFKPDAAIALNPFNPVPARTGLLIPGGTVDDSAIAITAGGALNYGLNATLADITFAVVAGPNNVAMLRQKNAAGTAHLSLVGMDSSNRLLLGADITAAIYMPLAAIRDYATQAAARAAGLIVGGLFYNTTTTAVDQLRS